MRRNTAISSALLGAALLFGQVQGQAAEDVGQAYVKGLGTYIGADGDRNVDDKVAGGLVGFGYALSEHFNVELDFQRLNLDGDSGFPDQDQSAVNLNLINLYNRSGLFSPYILAGVGVVNTNIGNADHDDFQAQLGVGALTRLWGSRLSLRTEVLGRYQDASSSLTDVLVNAGFSVALGSKPTPVAVAAPVVAAAVAAPPPPPPRPAPPVDSDGDGVPDTADQCPNTPKGERVGANGCTCDVVRQVHFASDSAKLTDEDKATLDELVETLTKLKFVSGSVIGHTDSTGEEGYNQKLSERRAQAVADYLAAKGVGGGRLVVSGAGETQPVADNKTKEGRALNRRVVLRRTDCDAG
ncbi:MAG: OmpA family protein [Gammaproteobacteria bacterium]